MDIFLVVLRRLFLILGVLVGVAFLTLLERKVLGYIQIRKGPNKVGFVGLPQPFADAVKLFTKEQTWPEFSNYFLYYFSPIFSLFLSLVVWIVFPYLTNLYSFGLGTLFFLCCTSIGVYGVIIAGWASNSNYALLGGLRAVAQTISYEVSLVLLLLSFIYVVGRFNLMIFSEYQLGCWFIFMGLPLGLSWFSSSLAETNRTPFDFAEGESELVSGFNVEYRGGGFALIFLAEYSSILFIRIFFSLVFLGGNIISFYFYLKLVFVAFAFIWIRGTLPRFRYDKLIYLAWRRYLPLSLHFFIFFVGLKLFMVLII